MVESGFFIGADGGDRDDWILNPLVTVEHGAGKVPIDEVTAFRDDPQNNPLPLGEGLSFVIGEGAEIVRDIRAGLLLATGFISETGQTADVRIHKPRRRSHLAKIFKLTPKASVEYNSPAFSDAKIPPEKRHL